MKSELKNHSQFLLEGPARVVIFTTHQTSKERIAALRSQGADVYTDGHDKVNLVNALSLLKELGINRLMVEGGATLNFELLRLGLVDEVTAYVAPLIFGGATAPTLAAGSGLKRSKAIPLKLIQVESWDECGVVLKYQLER